MDIRARSLGATVLLLSPHLDDAVYGCGELIGELDSPVVVTPFAGIPPHDQPLTAWDAAAGFESSVEAMVQRRREDEDALHRLGARFEHLDFLDAQYDATPSDAALAQAVQEEIERHCPDLVLLPLGLYHSDHVLLADAVLAVLGRPCVAYEDVPYRRRPGLVQQRLSTLEGRAVRATPMAWSGGDRERKRAAVRCYASQWRAFGEGGCADADAPESYWWLEDVR